MNGWQKPWIDLQLNLRSRNWIITHAMRSSELGRQSRAVAGEKIDRKIGPPVLRKVGKHFPEHGDELEPVTGQTGGERHLRVFRMPANNEMPVRAQRI